MEQNKEDIYSPSAYDDAFRTMESKCDDILIPFVNYFFNEKYDDNAVITRMRNEYFIEHMDHSDEKRITDSHFSISQNGIMKKYHLECESKKYDGTILIRLFEYDSLVAMDGAESDKDKLRVRFPYTGLLLLRDSNNAPREAEIVIETNEGNVSYHIPIIRESDFDIDTIFEKKLYFLIPFYIFNYESEFKDMENDQSMVEAMFEKLDSIFKRLEKENSEGRLSVLSHSVIINNTHRVMAKLTANHKVLKEKVGDFMGGQVLDLPEIRAYDEGVAKGIEQGIEQGIDLRLIDLICKKVSKGKSVAKIADEIEEKEEIVDEIVKVIMTFGEGDHNSKEIYMKWKGEKKE